MGKIRVNTIGDESLEKKQKEKAEKRREGKKLVKEDNAGQTLSSQETMRDSGQARMTKEDTSHKAQNDKGVEEKKAELASNATATKKKMVKKSSGKAKIRSKRYSASLTRADKAKTYTLTEALDLLFQMEKVKFDESVELHINTTDKINGNIILPHGTGKQTRVAILAPSKDAKAADDLLKAIEAGKIEFDILVATPDAMPRLAKVARVLGPKGLMPNPKNGTITTNPEEVAKKYAGGQVNFKTEAKANIIHLTVGKLSFGKEKLTANITSFLAAVDGSKVTSAFLTSTMSPSLRLQIHK